MTDISPSSFDVSRETMEKLAQFAELVGKWTRKINLVSKSSVSDLWNRHIWDSVQVTRLALHGTPWVDIGSGGGFPGLIAAVIASEERPEAKFVLIESDVRKCAFLREASRMLQLNTEIISRRIENVPPQEASILSARALADLSDLMAYAERHLAPTGTALFMKGAMWKKEVEAARESWSFSLQVHKSKTDEAAAILEVKDIARI